ncbi:MAG: hypothetical protein ACJAVK_003150 [Akkermansiaceae bacterium]|jgi:hypothetical protein
MSKERRLTFKGTSISSQTPASEGGVRSLARGRFPLKRLKVSVRLKRGSLTSASFSMTAVSESQSTVSETVCVPASHEVPAVW